MMNITNYTLFAIVLTLTIGTSHGLQVEGLSNKQRCRQQMNNTDTCLRKLLLYKDDNGWSIPRTELALELTYCSTIRETFDCVKAYQPCLKRVPKQIYCLVITNVKNMMKEICTSPQGRRTMLRHLRCIKNENIAEFHRILDLGAEMSYHILEQVAPRDIIPWACCSYHTVLDEGIRELNKLCTNSTTHYILNLIKQVVAETVELGCGQRYATMQMCRQYMPEVGTVFGQVKSEYDTGVRPKKNQSPVIPVIKLARKLGNENLD